MRHVFLQTFRMGFIGFRRCGYPPRPSMGGSPSTSALPSTSSISCSPSIESPDGASFFPNTFTTNSPGSACPLLPVTPPILSVLPPVAPSDWLNSVYWPWLFSSSSESAVDWSKSSATFGKTVTGESVKKMMKNLVTYLNFSMLTASCNLQVIAPYEKQKYYMYMNTTCVYTIYVICHACTHTLGLVLNTDGLQARGHEIDPGLPIIIILDETIKRGPVHRCYTPGMQKNQGCIWNWCIFCIIAGVTSRSCWWQR